MQKCKKTLLSTHPGSYASVRKDDGDSGVTAVRNLFILWVIFCFVVQSCWLVCCWLVAELKLADCGRRTCGRHINNSDARRRQRLKQVGVCSAATKRTDDAIPFGPSLSRRCPSQNSVRFLTESRHLSSQLLDVRFLRFQKFTARYSSFLTF